MPSGALWRAQFRCMASSCEVLMQLPDSARAQRLAEVALREARRIEAKFSRYRADSVVSEMRRSQGRPIRVDDETAGLLDLAARVHTLSDGRFDVTSGVLRRVWTFDGSNRVPTREQVQRILPLVGWQRVHWKAPELRLPSGMEIDLGGLGKEYAVDRVASLLAGETDVPFLVNFGGDLRVNRARRDGSAWCVGVEDPGSEDRAERLLELRSGGLATSGDARRFLLKDGVTRCDGGCRFLYRSGNPRHTRHAAGKARRELPGSTGNDLVVPPIDLSPTRSPAPLQGEPLVHLDHEDVVGIDIEQPTQAVGNARFGA
jgi:thiamine biosynthesis lipoprotein